MTTMHTLPSRRTMLRAVAGRDPQWDGLFIVAVRSTGIACRPVCPSRPAREEHLEFFPTLDQAVAAGFRPCKRCRPDQLDAEPDWWTRAVLLAEQRGTGRLADHDLAAAGIDPVRIRRHARRTHGMTFHAWLRTRRIAAAQRQLRQGESLDRVIVGSAWESHSGFRDAFTRVAGRSPGSSRDAEPISVVSWQSPLGPLVLAAIDAGVCLLEFGDQRRVEKQAASLHRWFGGPVVRESHRHLDHLRQQLTEYFDRQRREFTVPLVIRGTRFETSTWNALLRIPYGTTVSYSDIAAAMGSPRAVRAVGSANGRNRIAIVIPCHRVVNADGKLGGYGGGLWRKQRLLELESGDL
ncbi:MAG TPA: methylated-DNA--[protein]-cysteine S-methyltransferase [Gemmatimonadales bacterium]|nr:methylated-DNA--[protein]-cysteine S-methyltransferase [Gemmatimonadales bacterium]